MPKLDPHRFRLERAKELDLLAEILIRNGVCSDPSPLYKASSACRARTDDRWGYSVERLLFRIPEQDLKHRIPDKVYDVNLAFSTSITGHCNEGGEIRDPLHTLEFNIVINGKHNYGGKTNTVMCSWHLDRDVRPGAGTHTFIHPCYHFQHGGRHTWNSRLNFGASLILESPRYAHPPMDEILGIDFVLTNYIKSSNLSFRDRRDYKKLLKNAQERMWRPYIQALVFAWGAIPNDSEWRFTLPWPQLVG